MNVAVSSFPPIWRAEETTAMLQRHITFHMLGSRTYFSPSSTKQQLTIIALPPSHYCICYKNTGSSQLEYTLSEMYILEWLVGSTTICTLFDRGTEKVSSSKGTSQFSMGPTCTPKLASVKPLDCSSRIRRTLHWWNVPPKTTGLTPYCFYLRWHLKDLVYVPHLSKDFDE